MAVSGKQASIMAVSAAVYAVFFFLSGLVSVPSFTILYLPVVLLGTFPLWFGWSGLVGSIVGAFIGGAFVEGLGFLSVFESATAFIIYSLIWLLAPKDAAEGKEKRSLALLIGVYAVSLFAGTSYILWQYTVLPAIFSVASAETILLPTFGLNLVIEAIVCPPLLRVLSPKMRSWGFQSSNTRERLNSRKPKPS